MFDGQLSFTPDEAKQLEAIWLREQEALAQLSSQSEFLIAQRNGHLINLEQPEIVVAAVKKVLAGLTK